MAAMVVASVLLAALLHATWSAMAKSNKDQLAGFTAICLSTLALGVVAVLVAPAPDRSSWPMIAISGSVHVVYMLLLVWSYRIGDFSQVYPLARGSSPLLVTLAGVVVVGETPPVHRLVGVALVVVGLLLLALAGGHRGVGNPTAVFAALCTGVTITCYTVIDGVGVRRSHSVLGYSGWLFIWMSVWFVVVAVLVRRGEALRSTRPVLLKGLLGGALSAGAYGLVLLAQTKADLGVVSALRETSIVFGAVIGALFLGEPLGRRRVLASAVVVAGVLLIA
jgi:drug/metabolite transporter (DMT)-like permease